MSGRIHSTSSTSSGASSGYLGASSLEARSKIELKHPSLTGPLKRTRQVELAYRETEKVHSQRRTRRRNRATRSTQDQWTHLLVPGRADVGKERNLHRQR